MMYDENMIEKYVIEMYNNLGYVHINGKTLDSSEVIMKDLLIEKISKFSNVEKVIVENHLHELFNFVGSDVVEVNKQFLRLLKDGKAIIDKNINYHLKLIDTNNIENNEFMIVDQYTIKGPTFTKRPDLIVYVNGLPLTILELKNGFNIEIGLEEAYNQLDTYKNTIPELFKYIQFNVISNGIITKVGTFTSSYNRYAFYREKSTMDFDITFVIPELFSKKKLIDIILNYTEYSFDAKKHTNNKILLQYHQIRAIDNFKKTFDGGYIWHTQGSGKSFTMAFMALQTLKHDTNARIVVVTDRNDLDTQLYNTFLSFNDTLLRSSKQIDKRSELKEELSKARGAVTFTTIQKLEKDHGEINNSKHIYVFTDEAHRSQYGLDKQLDHLTGEFKSGYAQMLRDAFPSAKFIGFTGTPIENKDKSTIGVFGPEIDKYDITESVNDHSTVPIKYHPMPQVLNVDESMIKQVEDKIEELKERGENEEIIEKEVRKISNFQAIIGDETRIKALVNKMLEDFDNNLKMTGFKAMFIATNREIAVKAYNEIKRIRPEMCNEDFTKGKVKVVMTGVSSDSSDMVKHHTTTEQRAALANRFKDVNDELSLAIVVDMWLTGFDVPCVNTMYVDKIMRNHTLMQAITRVNRVYPNKEEGRIIDFIGISQYIKEALQIYSPSGKTTSVEVHDREKNLTILKQLIEECQMLTPSLSWRKELKNGADKLILLSRYKEIIIGIDIKNAAFNETSKKDKRTNEIKDTITKIKNLKNLVITDLTNEEKEEIAFLEAVLVLCKTNITGEKLSIEDLKNEIRSKLSSYFTSVETLEVMELLSIAGNSIDIFNNDFLEAIRSSSNVNSNIDLLTKLLKIKFKEISRESMVKSDQFGELLRETINRFQKGVIDNIQALEELIGLSHEVAGYKMNVELTSRSVIYNAINDIIKSKKKFYKEDTTPELIEDCVNSIEDYIIEFEEEYPFWLEQDNLIAKLKNKNKRILAKVFTSAKIKSINDLIINQLKVMGE